MATLIVYATKHGCTEKCAQNLSERLTGEVRLHNLTKGRVPDLGPYEKVIIGGSIHVGGIQKEVKEFCAKHLKVLRQKKVGLFVCGMMMEKAEEELNGSFPGELLDQAVAKEFFGGEFNFKKMNPLDRMMVKKVAKVDRNVSNIFADRIARFADAMNVK